MGLFRRCTALLQRKPQETYESLWSVLLLWSVLH